MRSQINAMGDSTIGVFMIGVFQKATCSASTQPGGLALSLVFKPSDKVLLRKSIAWMLRRGAVIYLEETLPVKVLSLTARDDFDVSGNESAPAPLGGLKFSVEKISLHPRYRVAHRL